MAITVKSMGGGGASSADVTASSAQVLAGYTAITTDSNDEPKQGTIVTKTVADMTVSANTVTAPAGYYANDTSKSVPVSTLDNSIISGTAYEEETGDYAWRSTVQVPAGYHEALTLIKDFSEIFPAPTTEGTADKMRLGYQLYNHEGKVITGTMTETSAATYTASTSDQIISGDQYLMGPQTIKSVSLNVTASNMKSGTTANIISNNSVVTSVTGTLASYNGECHVQDPPSLCFTANTAGSTISMSVTGTPTLNLNFQYSSSGKDNWIEFIPGTTTITLTNAGDKVYFRGNNPNGLSESNSVYYKFGMSGSIAASGNIMSLIDNGACNTTIVPNLYCFVKLFEYCSALTTAPELPATTLADYCYLNLFNRCTTLATAPVLPATTATTSCYSHMFAFCSSLSVPPELPATTLADYCYSNMFFYCTSLITPPELTATTLAIECYDSMFKNCTSLTTPPALPATTLASNCYHGMFGLCSALTTVPALPATRLSSSCYYAMFSGCSNLIVSDTPGTGYDIEWRVPSVGTFTNNMTLSDMFSSCAGTRSSDNLTATIGGFKTYYTQNPPV